MHVLGKGLFPRQHFWHEPDCFRVCACAASLVCAQLVRSCGEAHERLLNAGRRSVARTELPNLSVQINKQRREARQ